VSDAAAVEQRKTVCNRDCPDTCGIVATVSGGRVLKLGGDPEHPITRGFLCYRTNQFLKIQYSPERLTAPLLRKSGRLVPVSWQEALDFATERLLTIRQESGAAAIFHYRSGGSLGLLKTLSDYYFQQFGPVTTKRGDICSGAGEAAQELDFGVCDSSDLSTLLESRNIILWGKNVHTSSPHTLVVLQDAIKRGAKVALIDPVRHRGAKLAERYYQVAPGGDFALAMAVGGLLFERGHVDPQAAQYCDHLAEFEAMVRQRSVAAWCQAADLPVAAAEDLAARLGPGKPCAILVGWGMGRRSNGGAIVRAIDALAAISGNLGIAGGGVSFYYRRRAAFAGALPAGAAPPRTVCEATFAEELLSHAAPPIRALWVTAGNPVAMLPDSARTARAIESLEFSVVVDCFLTDTARLATLVLPTTTLLEEEDLLGSYGHHYVAASRPVVAPPAGVRTDLQIVQELANRTGLGALLAGSAQDWKQRFVAARLQAQGVTLAQLEAGPIKNPEAPAILFADRRFFTPSGRVQLLHELPAAPPDADPEYPLQLMALSTPGAQSSQWADQPPSPLELRVHPDSALGIASGATCRLESRIGEIQVIVSHDTGLRRDTALLPKGGHQHLGASGNSLIRGRVTDLGEGGALYEERVRLVPLSR
jgi:anaerobic selenocysteine-containing dehydrogenase